MCRHDFVTRRRSLISGVFLDLLVVLKEKHRVADKISLTGCSVAKDRLISLISNSTNYQYRFPKNEEKIRISVHIYFYIMYINEVL